MSASENLTIATRRSALALWQSRHVAGLLQDTAADVAVELLELSTRGDRILDQPLAALGGKGLFLKELERALLAGEADLAVHSYKDVPYEATEGLEIAAVLPRANPFDGLIGAGLSTLSDLPEAAVVGTSSLRRRAQLLHARPDLEVRDLRGNVDTRLAKLDAGEYDAIVLACAGLERLGWGKRVAVTLDAPAWLPAASQGAICIQIRAADDRLRTRLAALHDPSTARAVGAERAVAERLQASCEVPMAAFARYQDGALHLSALVASADGTQILRTEMQGDPGDPLALGYRAADALLSMGAEAVLQH